MHVRDTFDPHCSPAKATRFAALLPLTALALCAGLAVGCGPKADAGAGSAAPTGGGGEAKALMEKRCSTCHGLSAFKSAKGDVAKWTSVVDTMVGKGLKVTDDEKKQIVGYLAETQPL
jgi:hypothetical protein